MSRDGRAHAVMLGTYKELIVRQYQAALATLDACVAECPESLWRSLVGVSTFDRWAFHAAFYTDLYLEREESTFRDQSFHEVNSSLFGGYEELETVRPSAHYSPSEVRSYIGHCLQKVSRAVDAETADTLAPRCKFKSRDLSQAELHVYNIRHIQHHAGQLSLHLRTHADIGVPWIGYGWKH